MKFYISFGQEHAHSFQGQTFDKDSLMLVEAPTEISARLGINAMTGRKWSSLYQEEDLAQTLHYFPRGVINADRPIRILFGGVPKCDGEHGGPRCGDPECWNQ